MNITATQVDLEAVTAILERLTQDHDDPLDRSRVRRALEDATFAWPDETGDRWWQRIIEAGQALGRKCRVVDASVGQWFNAINDGAQVITYLPSSRQWLSLREYSTRRIEVHRPMTHPDVLLLNERQAIELFKEAKIEGTIRGVIVEPVLVTGMSDSDHELTPLQRLIALIRADRTDILNILIFAVVTGVLALGTPLAVESLVNTVAFGRFMQPVVVLAILLLVCLIFSGALRALQVYVAEIIQRRLFARLAADLAFRLPRIQWSEMYGHSPRELVNRFFDVVTVQKATSQLLLDGITLVLNAVIGMAVLGFYHPWLLGFDVVLIALITFAVFFLGRGAVTTSIKESKIKYHTAGWMEELASCSTAFRYDGASEFALERTDRLILEYLNARRKHFHILMRQILFALGLQAVASTVLLGLGGWLVIAGQLTLGQVVAAELIVTVIVGSFAKLGKHLETFYDMLAAVDKIGVLMDLPLESEGHVLDVATSAPATISLQQVVLAPTRAFEEKPLDLTIAAGEHTAITGPSGSGKTLLLELLFGLRSPVSGHAELNHVDLRNLRPDLLRRQVALAREPEHFEGSITEQVHLERPEISTQDMRNALITVGMHDDLLHLPEGLDTVIGADGSPLTLNQWRLMMIARAIVGRPKLLLIDGLLDCLPDDEAESLLNRLTSPEQPWTLILVTGRRALANRLAQITLAGQRRLNSSPPNKTNGG